MGVLDRGVKAAKRWTGRRFAGEGGQGFGQDLRDLQDYGKRDTNGKGDVVDD